MLIGGRSLGILNRFLSLPNKNTSCFGLLKFVIVWSMKKNYEWTLTAIRSLGPFNRYFLCLSVRKICTLQKCEYEKLQCMHISTNMLATFLFSDIYLVFFFRELCRIYRLCLMVHITVIKFGLPCKKCVGALFFFYYFTVKR